MYSPTAIAPFRWNSIGPAGSTSMATVWLGQQSAKPPPKRRSNAPRPAPISNWAACRKTKAISASSSIPGTTRNGKGIFPKGALKQRCAITTMPSGFGRSGCKATYVRRNTDDLQQNGLQDRSVCSFHIADNLERAFHPANGVQDAIHTSFLMVTSSKIVNFPDNLPQTGL